MLLRGCSSGATRIEDEPPGRAGEQLGCSVQSLYAVALVAAACSKCRAWAFACGYGYDVLSSAPRVRTLCGDVWFLRYLTHTPRTRTSDGDTRYTELKVKRRAAAAHAHISHLWSCVWGALCDTVICVCARDVRRPHAPRSTNRARERDARDDVCTLMRHLRYCL